MEQKKEEKDKSLIVKEIKERQKIIDDYKNIHYLNRQKAIEKIKELRATDKDVASATAAALAKSSVPFEQATNEALIAELQMQIDILAAKLK